MNLPSSLESWGWKHFFQQQIQDHATAGAAAASHADSGLIARVLNQERERYQILYFHDEGSGITTGQISGKFRHEHAGETLQYPAVGDWIFCELHSQGDGAIIHRVFQRSSCLYRQDPSGGGVQVVATNVDQVGIVMAANRDFNLNRLDRYMSMVWESGAIPVMILSKCDLCPEVDQLVLQLEQAHPGIRIFPISTQWPESIQAFQASLAKASTVVFLGSSGVGKSTLSNLLLGTEEILTQSSRADDDRGKHTTTSRSLYRTSSGVLIMDTPGMRLLGLVDQAEGLADSFEDISALLSQCRFTDCQHQSEPGCAILAALEVGEIELSRWQSFAKLQRELQFQSRKQSKSEMKAQKEVWKKRTVQMHERVKRKGKGEAF